MATAPIIEAAKAGWDEATDAAIQQDLEEKYKPRGLEGIRDFVDRVGRRQRYFLIEVAPETADRMMFNEFTTIEELQDYNDTIIQSNPIYILYREQPNPDGGDALEIIETIIFDQ